MGKNRKDEPVDAVIAKNMSPKTGLIDSTSINDYKSTYSLYKANHGKNANPQMEEYVETRIHKTVEDQKKKRKRDITSVAASTAAGTVIPFSGIPIMVATTMVQCVGFSASLGLIPITNVRSFQDVNTLASQLTATLQKASSSGMKAAIEAFVLEVLKQSGIGYWLWDEILKDIVIEITSGVVMEAGWVLTPLFAAPKYILHRKLIKKMYASLGEKAIVVHKAWVNEHLFLGKPEIVPAAAPPVIGEAGLETNGAFPTGYTNSYPTTGQVLYQSNSEEGVPYPVYYQPAFSSSAHKAPDGQYHAPPHHSNSFPQLPQHPHSQYAYYPPSHPLHPFQGQTISSSWGSQDQQCYAQTYPYQQGTYTQVPNQPPQSSCIPASNSVPNLQAPYGSSTVTSSNPGQNYSQAPPASYPPQGQTGESGHQYLQVQSSPQQQQGGNVPPSSNPPQNYSQAPPAGNHPPSQTGESWHQYSQSQYTQQQGAYIQPSSNPAQNYSQPPPVGYPSESYHQGGYDPISYPSAPPLNQQTPPAGSSYYVPSQSQPSYSAQQSHFPIPYPTAEQKRPEKMSYGPTPSHQFPMAASAPPPKLAEAC